MKYQENDLLLLPQSGWVEVIKISDGFLTVRPANKKTKKFETLTGNIVEFQSSQNTFYISVNSEAIDIIRHKKEPDNYIEHMRLF